MADGGGGCGAQAETARSEIPNRNSCFICAFPPLWTGVREPLPLILGLLLRSPIQINLPIKLTVDARRRAQPALPRSARSARRPAMRRGGARKRRAPKSSAHAPAVQHTGPVYPPASDADVVLLLHRNRDVWVPGDVNLVANLNLVEHSRIDDTPAVFPSVRASEDR